MLTPSQRAFATSKAPFPSFIGGFGSGKTAAAIARAMSLKTHFKTCDIAYYLPTYPLVEDIAFRRFPELCERKGWAYKLNKASSFIEFPGSGRVVFRTMENPERIVGYEVAHSILDELDTLPTEKARNVWNKVIARNRQKCSMGNTVAVATTPEGFRFVHERWVKNPAPGYVMFQARTMDNVANLPADYIDNLRNSYPPSLLDAYLDGKFVNLTSGTVYRDFDRHRCDSSETIKDKEPLFIGQDFNVGEMSSVIFVRRENGFHAVAEIMGVYDTPELCRVLKERYSNHRMYVYPDASGSHRKSVDASKSDISLLQQAGAIIRVKSINPGVKDRINAMNIAFSQAKLWVNTRACPSTTANLEQQAYGKNGEPDKSGGHDHSNDAAGYVVAYEMPVIDQTMRRITIGGV